MTEKEVERDRVSRERVQYRERERSEKESDRGKREYRERGETD